MTWLFDWQDSTIDLIKINYKKEGFKEKKRGWKGTALANFEIATIGVVWFSSESFPPNRMLKAEPVSRGDRKGPRPGEKKVNEKRVTWSWL